MNSDNVTGAECSVPKKDICSSRSFAVLRISLIEESIGNARKPKSFKMSWIRFTYVAKLAPFLTLSSGCSFSKTQAISFSISSLSSIRLISIVSEPSAIKLSHSFFPETIPDCRESVATHFFGLSGTFVKYFDERNCENSNLG